MSFIIVNAAAEGARLAQMDMSDQTVLRGHLVQSAPKIDLVSKVMGVDCSRDIPTITTSAATSWARLMVFVGD
jgi:hypothetical protein